METRHKQKHIHPVRFQPLNPPASKHMVLGRGDSTIQPFEAYKLKYVHDHLDEVRNEMDLRLQLKL